MQMSRMLIHVADTDAQSPYGKDRSLRTMQVSHSSGEASPQVVVYLPASRAPASNHVTILTAICVQSPARTLRAGSWQYKQPRPPKFCFHPGPLGRSRYLKSTKDFLPERHRALILSLTLNSPKGLWVRHSGVNRNGTSSSSSVFTSSSSS